MSKIVQILGHLKNLADKYRGADRELTVDTSNWDLRLHDGSTVGGRVIQSRDNADERYQPKSDELAGFGKLEPQQRGFMARLGPADYRLRRITVNDQNLTIQHGNGFDGHPLISLAPVVESQHEWSAQQKFTEVVQFEAGINANVSGDLTGDVTGNVTGNLTGDSTGTHTGPTIGPVDVRGEDLLLDTGQIPLGALAGLADAISDGGVPVGIIVMWSGSVPSIPDNWALCDGTNGTPNLTDRFILGAGQDRVPGDVGGAFDHKHGVTIESGGAHTHNIAAQPTSTNQTNVSVNRTTVSIENEQSQEAVVKTVAISDPGHAHQFNGATDSGGAHIHSADSSLTNHLPPFYALAFIMRV